MHNVLSKEIRERLPPLRGIEKYRILEATRKVDEFMKKTEVGNITGLNDLVYAGAVVVIKMFEVKNRKCTEVDPWWKKENGSTSNTIKQRPWDFNTLINRKNMKKKHKDGLERRFLERS